MYTTMCLRLSIILQTICFYITYCGALKMINSCTCDLGTGKVIDLSKLAKSGGSPRFLDVPDTANNDQFSFNPCKGFTEGTCENVAVCQTRAGLNYNAGNQDGIQCTQDSTSSEYTFVYSADSPASNVVRTTVVLLQCDNSKEGDLQVTGEVTSATYLMTLTSKYACPVTPTGISVGTVLLIVFVCLVFVYFVAGIIFQTLKRGATGKERIPNYSLWIELPSLVKEGTMYTVSKITRREYRKI